MNKLKMFKFYMLTTCVSYTFVILLQTLLFHFNHYLELQEWLTNLLSIIEIAFVVCTANYLCGYTNSIIELDNFIGVTFMSVTVYFFVKAVVFMKNNEDAKKINEKLKRNHHRN